jgi:hypothetical protein
MRAEARVNKQASQTPVAEWGWACAHVAQPMVRVSTSVAMVYMG